MTILIIFTIYAITVTMLAWWMDRQKLAESKVILTANDHYQISFEEFHSNVRRSIYESIMIPSDIIDNKI